MASTYPSNAVVGGAGSQTPANDNQPGRYRRPPRAANDNRAAVILQFDMSKARKPSKPLPELKRFPPPTKLLSRLNYVVLAAEIGLEVYQWWQAGGASSNVPGNIALPPKAPGGQYEIYWDGPETSSSVVGNHNQYDPSQWRWRTGDVAPYGLPPAHTGIVSDATWAARATAPPTQARKYLVYDEYHNDFATNTVYLNRRTWVRPGATGLQTVTWPWFVTTPREFTLPYSPHWWPQFDPNPLPIQQPNPAPRTVPHWAVPSLPKTSPNGDPLRGPSRGPALDPRWDPSVQPGPRPQPEPAPRPGTLPAPGSLPGFTPTPAQGFVREVWPRPGLALAPAGRAAPPPGTKEKKLGIFARGTPWGFAVNALTEGADFVGAIWGALPAGARTMVKGRKTSPQQMAIDIYNGFDQIDWSLAMQNIVIENAIDMVGGYFGRLTRRANQMHGHTGFGKGPAL